MNIFFTNFHHGWGGQPLQVLQLAIAMKKRGHKVLVFAPDKSDLVVRARGNGLDVDTSISFRRGFRPITLYRDIKEMVKKCRQNDIDIIHCHGSQDSWIAAMAILIGRLKARLVRTKHNSYSPARHYANRWFYNSLVAHTITVAKNIAIDLIGDNFVDESKVSVIHAGLDDNFCNSKIRNRSEILGELKIPDNSFLIGLVGRLAPDKGQDVLLQATPIILKEIPHAHVVLVGTGGDWDRIKAMISELRLENNVTWAGFRSDVAAITSALDVSLLAAKACDASSTVLKEAMILGVPVVATDVGGTVEIVDNGRAGILVLPNSCEALAKGIIEVYKNAEKTEERVKYAKEYVKKYLSSEIARKTEEVYAKVISGELK